ncbi:MAG: single-stranded DNA-binding protein [Elusimicrobia bacterium CG_4_10_14_0_2_um_filter_56_8]|nr:MAG: single-stranded DNA-binding protein [Elusimicrobia bacterium CG_4_10_14_0_2_um_filter_56_8]
MDIRIPELNQVLIAGRLTRDPELRFTQKGQGMSFFSVAVNRRYKDPATGEWKDDTTFVSVTVWGPAAERCKEKLKKGSPVIIEGRLAASEYTDKTGQKRKEMKVTARRVQQLTHEAAAAENGEAASRETEEAQADTEPKGDVSGIEEVPF